MRDRVDVAALERLRAVVAIDTSGSTENDIARFLGELGGILASFENYEVSVIQSDARIQPVRSYDDACPATLDGDAVDGRGGTSFVPVFGYVTAEFCEDTSVLVYLTDGYGNAPASAPCYPELWVLTHDGRVPAPWGEALFLPKPDEE